MRSASIALLLLAIGASGLSAAQAGYQYELFDVPGQTDANPRSINAAGLVAGDWRDASVRYHGFLRSAGGSITTHDHPGAWDTHFLGLNDLGTVVGVWSASGGTGGDFWFANGVYTPMPSQPGVAGGPSASNLAGRVVGSYSDSQWQQHGYIFDGHSFTTVDYPGAQHTTLVDINDHGLMLGNYWVFGSGRWRGFTFDGVRFTPLDKPGAHWTWVAGMNDSGMIAGQQVDVSGAVRTAILFDGAAWVDLQVPGATSWTGAQDVNDSGVVCGYWIGDLNGASGQHGFVATPQRLLDLDVAGACPGVATLTVTGAVPDARVAILRSPAAGAAQVPPGKPCAGIQLGLDAAGLALAVLLTADGAGSASASVQVPAAACGRQWLQALDLASCETSAVVAL